MYGLIPDDWGAYAAPWVAALAAPLDCLKALKLRRMAVSDDDVAALVRARGHMLQELRLDKCSGFSTDALRLVARSCRYGLSRTQLRLLMLSCLSSIIFSFILLFWYKPFPRTNQFCNYVAVSGKLFSPRMQV
jgi:hypothetical protein